MLVASRLAVTRLSGTAGVRIVSSELFGGSWFDQSPAWSNIRYTYTVGGITYAGADFRQWFDVASYRPKVCFDPANPASHLLVDGGYACGIGPTS